MGVALPRLASVWAAIRNSSVPGKSELAAGIVEASRLEPPDRTWPGEQASPEEQALPEELAWEVKETLAVLLIGRSSGKILLLAGLQLRSEGM